MAAKRKRGRRACMKTRKIAEEARTALSALSETQRLRLVYLLIKTNANGDADV